jgi:hypothetical protein
MNVRRAAIAYLILVFRFWLLQLRTDEKRPLCAGSVQPTFKNPLHLPALDAGSLFVVWNSSEQIATGCAPVSRSRSKRMACDPYRRSRAAFFQRNERRRAEQSWALCVCVGTST